MGAGQDTKNDAFGVIDGRRRRRRWRQRARRRLSLLLAFTWIAYAASALCFSPLLSVLATSTTDDDGGGGGGATAGLAPELPQTPLIADPDHGRVASAIAAADAVAARLARPRPGANPDGVVVHLTDATFASRTTEGGGTGWLVMFHAPWCPHCKTLAPVWDELASAVHGRVDVAKVDCDAEPATAKRFGVRSYPTVALVQEPFGAVVYEGRRSLKALLEFADSLLTPPFKGVNASTGKELIAKEDSALFYVYDPDTTSTEQFYNFAKVALSLRTEIPVYVTPDPASVALLGLTPGAQSAPAMVLAKDGGTDLRRYPRTLDLASTNSRLAARRWIADHRRPLVPRLDAATTRDLLTGDNLVVLAFVDSAAATSTAQLAQLRRAAVAWSSARHRAGAGAGLPRDPVRFAWAEASDSVAYATRVYGVRAADVPRLIVAEPRRERYYDTGPDGAPLPFDPDGLSEALRLILDGKLE
ncbi:hypothetical protein HK405_011548, partial [Cladochytrium tenue]